MGYCLAIKRHELAMHATTGISVQNILLSERGPIQKVTYCKITFILIVHNIQTYINRIKIGNCPRLMGKRKFERKSK